MSKEDVLADRANVAAVLARQCRRESEKEGCRDKCRYCMNICTLVQQK